MVETLNNLKNNKTKKVGTQNQSGDAVERLKKYLSSLNKRSGTLAFPSIVTRGADKDNYRRKQGTPARFAGGSAIC